MPTTYSADDYQRAARWVERSGGLVYVPPAASDLLILRLRARSRALWQCAPIVALAFVVLMFGAVAGPSLGSENWSKGIAPWALAAIGLINIAAVVAAVLIARADRAIGRTLPNRVSRATAVSTLTMLGRPRTAFYLVAVAVDAAVTAATFVIQAGWIAWTFLIGCAITVSCAYAAVRRAATRATIAIDPMSLAIDERLRSQDAFAFSNLLYLFMLTLPTSPELDYKLAQARIIGYAVLGFLWVWAAWKRPWPTTPPPACPVAAPQLEEVR
jgi:hypothetical protein